MREKKYFDDIKKECIIYYLKEKVAKPNLEEAGEDVSKILKEIEEIKSEKIKGKSPSTIKRIIRELRGDSKRRENYILDEKYKAEKARKKRKSRKYPKPENSPNFPDDSSMNKSSLKINYKFEYDLKHEKLIEKAWNRFKETNEEKRKDEIKNKTLCKLDSEESKVLKENIIDPLIESLENHLLQQDHFDKNQGSIDGTDIITMKKHFLRMESALGDINDSLGSKGKEKLDDLYWEENSFIERWEKLRRLSKSIRKNIIDLKPTLTIKIQNEKKFNNISFSEDSIDYLMYYIITMERSIFEKETIKENLEIDLILQDTTLTGKIKKLISQVRCITISEENISGKSDKIMLGEKIESDFMNRFKLKYVINENNIEEFLTNIFILNPEKYIKDSQIRKLELDFKKHKLGKSDSDNFFHFGKKDKSFSKDGRNGRRILKEYENVKIDNEFKKNNLIDILEKTTHLEDMFEEFERDIEEKIAKFIFALKDGEIGQELKKLNRKIDEFERTKVELYSELKELKLEARLSVKNQKS